MSANLIPSRVLTLSRKSLRSLPLTPPLPLGPCSSPLASAAAWERELSPPEHKQKNGEHAFVFLKRDVLAYGAGRFTVTDTHGPKSVTDGGVGLHNGLPLLPRFIDGNDAGEPVCGATPDHVLTEAPRIVADSGPRSSKVENGNGMGAGPIVSTRQRSIEFALYHRDRGAYAIRCSRRFFAPSTLDRPRGMSADGQGRRVHGLSHSRCGGAEPGHATVTRPRAVLGDVR